MPSTIYGVLIADVLESRARADIRGLLGRKLAAVSKRHLRKKLIQLPYSVTAGDEFQTVTRDLPSVDRKSTRLNSSHLVISYAVFCLKKKKTFDSGQLESVVRVLTRQF